MNIEGIIPPVVTPFDRDENIDEAAFREVIRFNISKGVNGVCVGGSTGEGHTLDTTELARSMEIAAEETEGKISLIAGVIANSTRSAVEKVNAIDRLPIDGLQVTPVHYVFKPTEDATYEHFSRMADSSDIPIVIYNVVPWNYLNPDLLNRIMTGIPNVVGVKQSAGDLKLMADLLLDLPEGKLVLSAVDALLYPSFVLGAHGTIAANPAAIPGVCVKLWEAVQNGDHTKAQEIHLAMLRFWNTISAGNLPANVKYSLAKQGLKSGLPRMPMSVTTSEQAANIDRELEAVLHFEA